MVIFQIWLHLISTSYCKQVLVYAQSRQYPTFQRSCWCPHADQWAEHHQTLNLPFVNKPTHIFADARAGSEWVSGRRESSRYSTPSILCCPLAWLVYSVCLAVYSFHWDIIVGYHKQLGYNQSESDKKWFRMLHLVVIVSCGHVQYIRCVTRDISAQ